MIKAEEIKSSIETTINSYTPVNYKCWSIGSTTCLKERNTEWDKPNNGWHVFEAGSREEAAELELHFINKGMKYHQEEAIDENKTVFIYIFCATHEPAQSESCCGD